jgi:hypothetical protein
MSAIRMLFSWLTEKGILAMNPAREVKTEKFSRTEGKTPAFDTEQVQRSWIKLTRAPKSAFAIALCWVRCLRRLSVEPCRAIERAYSDLKAFSMKASKSVMSGKNVTL